MKTNNTGFTLAFLFACLMLILRGMTYCKHKPLQLDENVNKSVYNCQGKLFDSCEQDSITYTQHPNKKCWHTNWENR